MIILEIDIDCVGRLKAEGQSPVRRNAQTITPRLPLERVEIPARNIELLWAAGHVERFELIRDALNRHATDRELRPVTSLGESPQDLTAKPTIMREL